MDGKSLEGWRTTARGSTRAEDLELPKSGRNKAGWSRMKSGKSDQELLVLADVSLCLPHVEQETTTSIEIEATETGTRAGTRTGTRTRAKIGVRIRLKSKSISELIETILSLPRSCCNGDLMRTCT